MTTDGTIRLRAMEPEDLDMLYDIENDEQLWGVGSANVPYSRYTLHDYIATSQDDIFADRQVRLIITNDSGQTVGMADITNFDPRHRRAEVGLVIKSTFRCQGYARKAVEALEKYAADVVGLHQLYAIIEATNKPAINLFLSSGYDNTATLRQWLRHNSTYADAVLLQRTLE